MQALELRVPPLAIVVIFAVGMAGIAYVAPASIALPGRLLVVVTLALSGALIALAGVLAFRAHKTTLNPLKPEQSSSLVASGIYRLSRNPMYLGFLLVLAAWAAYLANWASALLLPLFVAYMNRFQIQPEERALSQRFEHEFTMYSTAVRRWL